ncbi:MAG: hypothetical protein H6937_00075 [Burkholderiales bacterium]|nr:hypothetical protein [Burkholderiales bacterium]MDR4518476.1 hypothetical protein [Nitrosomonas sp.]
MPTSEQIKRIRSDPDALDFDTLRKDALSLIQQISGDNWTDYNLHDPGVTILEQLCYALTDLSYRCEFPVKDYLAASNNTIDYEKQALFPPHEILPSSAVTELDYEKILYDAVPEIDQIWFKPYQPENGEVAGLYNIYVKIDTDLLQARTQTVSESEKQKKTINQICQLLDRLNRLYGLTDQITESLHIRQNALKRWQDRINRSEQKIQTEPFASITLLITKSGEVLLELEKQLSGLTDLRNQLDAIQETLVRQSCNPEGTGQFGEQLTLLEQLFDVPLPIVEFEQILSILDFPIKKLNDLIVVLENVLPRLTTPLNDFAVFLRNRIDDLRNVTKLLMSFYETGVKKKILQVYSANRGLGEDVHSIEVIETKPFFMVGKIEIHPSYIPAKVYAEIFFHCSRYISSSIQIEHYGAVLTEDKNYERVFTGPLTQHGYIRDEFLETQRSTITVMDLMTQIRKIKGVVRIQNLNLLDKTGRRYLDLDYQLSQHYFPALYFSDVESNAQQLHLKLPQDEINHADPETITLKKNAAAKTAVFYDEFNRELEKLVFEYHAFRRNCQPFSRFIPLPQGRSRQLDHYYSVQNHFPAIYGINKYGIPRSKSLEAQAKVKQLKAYLFPFEQLMANFLQGLQEIPELFSVNGAPEKTYFSQFLDNSKIPDIETLYTDRAQDKPSAIDDILRHYDDYGKRKNRLLDILLALYGEVYEQQQLLRFNYYRPDDADNWIIEQKINYLKHIREITRDRGKGFDYCRQSLATQSDGQRTMEISSALHARISLLLGLKCDGKPGFVTAVLSSRKSRLVSDQMMAGKVKYITEKKQSEGVPPIAGFKSSGITIPSRLPVFSYSLFKEGLNLENYRLVRSGPEQEETTVCFRSEQGGRLWILAKESTFYGAARYAQQFCSTLKQLNEASEYFYMIEHILLRPRGREPLTLSHHSADTVFFHYHVSFVFPNWTARFSDIAYRKFVKETVQMNLPAHLFADFYWLDFAQMQDFEARYMAWLGFIQQLTQNDEATLFPQLDQASEKIISFLKEYKQDADRDYWL